MSDAQLAATRETLAKALDDFYGSVDYLPTFEQAADAILSSGEVRDADEVKREAQEQGQGEGYLAMRAEYERHHHLPTEARLAIFRYIDLKAAIEALCEEPGTRNGFGVEVPRMHVRVDRLRALFAESTREGGVTELGSSSVSDGAAELREVKAQVWDNCVGWFGHKPQQVMGDGRHRVNINVLNAAEEANPYRDTAGEAGE